MRINFHIDRVVVHGLPLSVHQGRILRKNIEAKLSVLLTDQGLSGLQSGAVPSLFGGPIMITPGILPHEIGTQVAQAIYAGIRPASTKEMFAGSSGRSKR